MSIATEIRLRIKAEGEGVLKGLSGKLQDIANGTQVSSEKFKLLSTALKDIQSATAKSTNSIKDYSAAWRLLAGSVDASSAEFKEATKEANQLDAKLKSFQGSQTAVANNFRNIATAATEATAAMAAAARVTSTGLRMDPLTGAYRGIAGKTQYGQPIGPVLPPTTLQDLQTQQVRGASQQQARDARRRIKLQERAAYAEGTQFQSLGFGLDVSDNRTVVADRSRLAEYQERFRPAPRPAFYGRSTMAAPIGQRGPGAFRTGARVAGTAAAAGIFGGPEGALGALGGGLVGGVEGAAVGAGLGALVSQLRQLVAGFATYTAEIDKQRIALKGLTTSNSEYKASLQTVERLSQEFQIPQEQVTRNFTKLAASVIGAGGNLQAAEVAFRGIASGVRGTGGNLRDLDSALLATSQVFSKGKVSAEELRQQIGERLPGAFTLFAKSIGKTPQQLDKMLEDGQVTLNDFLTFTQSLVTKYGATQAQIVLSSQAAGDRLAVAFAKIQEDIGRALQPIGAELQDALTKALSQNKEAIVAFAQGMANAAKAIIEFTVKFGPAILEVGKFVAVLLTVSAAAKTFMALSGAFSGMFALLSSGFAATSQKAIVAQSRLTAFGLAAKGLARSLAGPIVITLVLLGAEKIIQAFTRVKNARDALANVKNMPSGEQFLRNIGGSKTDRETLIRNLNEITKASSQARTSLSKKEIRLESNKISGFEKDQLRPEIEALKAEIKVREDQYQTLSRALLGAKSGVKPLDANMFGADTTGGDGEGKEESAAAKALADSIKRTGILITEAGIMREIARIEDDINKAQVAGNARRVLELSLARDLGEIDKKYADDIANIKNTANKDKETEALLDKKEAEREKVKLQNQQQINALLREENEIRQDLAVRIVDAKLANKDLSDEDRKRVEHNRTLAGIIEQYSGKLGSEELLNAIKALNEQFEISIARSKDFGVQFGKSFQDGIKSMGELGTNLGSSFASAFEGMADQLTEFVTTGKMKFRDFAASVLKDISRMIIRYAIFNAVKGIMNIFNPAAALGSSAANLAQYAPLNAKGNVYAQNGIQAFARGGIVNGPTLFPFAKGIGLMGEAGPEAIMPLRRGRDGNLGVMSSGGGTTNVVVNVDASGSSVEGDQQQAKALGNAISAAVQSELVKQKRPGGLLA
jgi:tape measure domain-containing protein